MRISVKETVLEKLLKIRFYEKSIYFRRRDSLTLLRLEICHLCPVDELHRQNTPRRCVPVDLRDVDVRPVLEILAKAFGVVTLGRVVHLLVDRLVEFAEHARPIRVLVELREALGKIRDLVEDL